MSILPLFDHTQRLDMVDYFNAGMADRSDNNLLGGTSKIQTIEPDRLILSAGNAATLEISLLPTKKDTIVAFIETLETPAPDSNIRFFDLSWHELNIFKEPDITSWTLNKRHENEVARLVPFMLASATFDPTAQELIYTNNVTQWLDSETAAQATSLMAGQLRFKWNGTSFKRIK